MVKVWQARPSTALVVLFFIATSVQAADPAWIQYGPDGPIARTIVKDGGGCPEITLDGRAQPMRVHATPAKGYEVTVCQAAVPQGTTNAAIGATTLPAARVGRHERIVLVGDTGCRRKAGGAPQTCSYPQWPFAEIAASIAAWEPDAVLHVGDYYYREAATCTATTCSGTKYDWHRWDEDFFTPAAPLLAKAPWIFVRGNHEECGRAAEGWVRFLDPHNYVWENDKTCKSNLTFTPPYVVSLGELDVAVLDSSSAKDSDKTQAEVYAGQLRILGAKQGAWLTLHHPLWATDYDDQVTETLWTAWEQAKSATGPLSLAIVGHAHLLEILSFTDERTPLVLVGNGGTALDGAPVDGTGMTIGGRTVASFMAAETFGFIAATRTPTGWTMEIKDTAGKTTTRCAATAKSIVCD